jgi:hypothetical protein
MKLITREQFNAGTQLRSVNVECDYFDATDDVGLRIWGEPGLDLSIMFTSAEWAALMRAGVTPVSDPGPAIGPPG